MRLTRIYTRAGDAGETSLGDGSRVPKTDLRIEAYGTVDELNSSLGLVLAGELPDEFRPWLEQIQNDLFDLGADLAVPLEDERRERLRVTHGPGGAARGALRPRQRPARAAHELRPSRAAPRRLRGSTLPVPSVAGRSAARRRSRRCRRRNPAALAYLNRLSDLLFILARAANAGAPEPLWRPGSSQ